MILSMTDMTIDMVQSTKKQFVHAMVKDENLNKILVEFIDSQTKYTKEAIHKYIDTVSAVTAITTNKDFIQSCMNPWGVKKGK